MGLIAIDPSAFVERWIQAEWRGDVTELGQLLARDFVAAQPDGTLTDKNAWLQRYRNGDLVHNDLRWSTVLTIDRPYVAVVVGDLHHTSSYRGRPFSGLIRVTLLLDVGLNPAVLAMQVGFSSPMQGAALNRARSANR